MKKYIIHIVTALIFIAGCGDRPLFTDLATNRIKVKIKGTYESNDPRPWEDAFPNSASVDDYVSPPEDAAPTKFMLDIAEMRISDGKHTQKFANYRKTYSCGVGSAYEHPFFNGTGVTFENDDVRPNYTWRYVKMYVRKMLFDSAKVYWYNENRDDSGNVITDGLGEWSFKENNQDVFAEEDVDGLNFNLFQVNSYYDSLLYEADSINRIFPVVIPIEDTFVFNNDIPETVLEIRFVVKNFIKKYERDYITDNVRYATHFYALSDWLRNVKPGRVYKAAETDYVDECEVMGRNVIAVARSYIPGQTVTLTGSAGAPGCYVVAINENHNIDEYAAPDRTRPAYDEPKLPMLDLPLDLENVLDYYLKYENYKDDYDAFIDLFQYDPDVVDTGLYEDAWTKYEEGIKDFKIPALVTWSKDDGSFTFTNVPVGHIYTIYRSVCGNGTCNANELPGEFIKGPSPLYENIAITSQQAEDEIDLDVLFP